MGLGSDRSPWDDFEWFVLDDVPDAPVADGRYVDAALTALRADPLWLPDAATKILLVDLDNLRVEPTRLRGRIAMAVALARDADHAAFAGQSGSVLRAAPWLAEFGADAVTVGSAADAADLALLAAADDVEADDVQFVVLSNDGIFARLAMRGRLVVLSPGADALSNRLAAAAERVVDLQLVEAAAIPG